MHRLAVRSSTSSTAAQQRYAQRFYFIYLLLQHLIHIAFATRSDAIIIDFSDAHVAHSNLGSQGPDFSSPPSMLITNVGRQNGREIVLHISNTTVYQPDGSAGEVQEAANGLKPESNGTFGRVSLRAPGFGREVYSNDVYVSWYGPE